ncbi:MAG: fumarate hydratase C-terminal domain-containing protein [Endomicrobiia bacterium]
MDKSINLPITNNSEITSLKVGDKIKITGELFVFRDQVHKKIFEGEVSQLAEKNFLGAGVYYCAPSPVKEGFLVGSCGPNSSYRMDNYTEAVLKIGFKVMIGKGYRSDEIVHMCKRYKAIYIITYGGCGALLNQCVKDAKVVAYNELGTEAMMRFLVKDFPGYVAIDTWGNKLWK